MNSNLNRCQLYLGLPLIVIVVYDLLTRLMSHNVKGGSEITNIGYHFGCLMAILY